MGHNHRLAGVSCPEMAAAIRAHAVTIRDTRSPFASDRVLLNFLGGDDSGPERTRTAYSPEIYQRLAAIKAIYDPTNVFRFNHNIHNIAPAS